MITSLLAVVLLGAPGAGSPRAVVARAAAAIEQGALVEAEALLAEAAREHPQSTLVARERAVVLLRLGAGERALAEVDRALAGGDVEPEVHELRARILAELGRRAEAREAALLAGTWEAQLLAASLGDATAAAEASTWIDEASPRGALTALTLAAHAGTSGERTTARRLAALAEASARATESGLVLDAARDLSARLGEGERVRVGGRVRLGVDYATNPLFEPSGGSKKPKGLRSSLVAEAALQAPIATARLDVAARLDQRVQLLDRERLDGLDLSGLSLAASVEVPISSRPNAALVGLALRVHDLWGDAFDTHWATTVEGGPTLTFPLDAETKLVIGVYGVGVDFVDRSPPDALVSSQNRDRIGQRAVASLVRDGSWLDMRFDAAFLRDDAYGEAFDVRGGLLGGHLRARVTDADEIVLYTGASMLVRSFGPVGDALVLGSAATRLELRVTAELGAEVRLRDGLALIVEDTWIDSSGREGHEYTHNVLSIGLEARW